MAKKAIDGIDLRYAHEKINNCYRELAKEISPNEYLNSKFDSKKLIENIPESGKTTISIETPSKNWFMLKHEYSSPDMYTGEGGSNEISFSCKNEYEMFDIKCNDYECEMSRPNQ